MKNTIKLTALLLLAGAGVFAATPSKANVPPKATINVSSLHSLKGVDIKVESAAPATAVVTVYDNDGNPIFKDVMPKGTTAEKHYILTQLDPGDYTFEVAEGKQVVSKQIHVYEEYRTRAFIVKQ